MTKSQKTITGAANAIKNGGLVVIAATLPSVKKKHPKCRIYAGTAITCLNLISPRHICIQSQAIVSGWTIASCIEIIPVERTSCFLAESYLRRNNLSPECLEYLEGIAEKASVGTKYEGWKPVFVPDQRNTIQQLRYRSRSIYDVSDEKHWVDIMPETDCTQDAKVLEYKIRTKITC